MSTVEDVAGASEWSQLVFCTPIYSIYFHCPINLLTFKPQPQNQFSSTAKYHQIWPKPKKIQGKAIAEQIQIWNHHVMNKMVVRWFSEIFKRKIVEHNIAWRKDKLFVLFYLGQIVNTGIRHKNFESPLPYQAQPKERNKTHIFSINDCITWGYTYNMTQKNRTTTNLYNIILCPCQDYCCVSPRSAPINMTIQLSI